MKLQYQPKLKIQPAVLISYYFLLAFTSTADIIFPIFWNLTQHYPKKIFVMIFLFLPDSLEPPTLLTVGRSEACRNVLEKSPRGEPEKHYLVQWL